MTDKQQAQGSHTQYQAAEAVASIQQTENAALTQQQDQVRGVLLQVRGWWKVWGGGGRGGFRLRMPPSPSNRIRCVIFAAGQGMVEGVGGGGERGI